MDIPDFLKPENRKPISKDEKEFLDLIDEYKRVIGDDLMTEPFSRTTKEWIKLLKICIKKKKSYEKITGEVFEIGKEDVYY